MNETWRQYKGLYFPEQDESLSFFVSSFINAIDFADEWIIILICIQVSLFVLIVSTWKFLNIQVPIFFIILGVVGMAEPVNTWANKNYKLFSRQNYFTEEGIFVSVFLCVPLLIDALVILVNLTMTAANLLVKLKRLELINKLKNQNKKDN